MESYRVENGENTVKVSGRMKDDSQVEIYKNGQRYQYNKPEGDYKEDVTTMEFEADDGAKIQEGVNTQTIELPDGTLIEKDVAKRKVTLPDGTVIKNINTADYSFQTNNVRIRHSSSSSINIKIKSKSGKTYNIKTSDKDEKNVTLDEEKTSLIMSLIPGFWTTMAITFGILSNNTSILVIGIGMYFMFALPTTMSYVKHVLSNDVSEQDNEDEELSVEEKLEELQEEFAEGEIPEEEFDARVEKILNENENKLKNSDKLEMEKTVS